MLQRNYSWFQISVIGITGLFFTALAGSTLIAFTRGSHSTGMDIVEMQKIRVGQCHEPSALNHKTEAMENK